jgi:hypothetical protein
MSELSLEKQVQIAIAIGRYVRAERCFFDASKEHTLAQHALEELMGSDCRMVAKVDYKHYLAETDEQGGLLDVEQIEVL